VSRIGTGNSAIRAYNTNGIADLLRDRPDRRPLRPALLFVVQHQPNGALPHLRVVFLYLGRPVLAGRDFLPEDVEGERRAVIVNDSFVQRVLGGASPLGRELRQGGGRVRAPRGRRDAPARVGRLLGPVDTAMRVLPTEAIRAEG
jgi:hypothetical protein